jgi:hypothetical protein
MLSTRSGTEGTSPCTTGTLITPVRCAHIGLSPKGLQYDVVLSQYPCRHAVPGIPWYTRGFITMVNKVHYGGPCARYGNLRKEPILFNLADSGSRPAASRNNITCRSCVGDCEGVRRMTGKTCSIRHACVLICFPVEFSVSAGAGVQWTTLGRAPWRTWRCRTSACTARRTA